MANKKTLLRVVTNTLRSAFEHLQNIWESGKNDDFIDKEEIIGSTNIIFTIMSILNKSDFSDDAYASEALYQMQNLIDDMDDLRWSATYVRLEQLISDLKLVLPE